MVNITKRMHRLMPKLWRVKGGAGAAILPPKPPAPQLTSVVLRLPNPANAYDTGARHFWRRFLPSLQYHNLTLPIHVEQKLNAPSDFAPTLTLHFEATTREALEEQKTEPLMSDLDSLTKSRENLETKEKTRRRVETTGGPVAKKKDDSSWTQQLRKQQLEIGIPPKCETSVGAITIKPQPPADPSAPSTTSPPATLYQRTVTLGLRGRYALDIWRWFQAVTQARPYKLNKDERKQIAHHKNYEQSAEEDRQRVKKGIDAMRREKEDLKRAKEAAEKLAEV